MSDRRPPRAPAGLGAAGRRLWRGAVRELVFRPDELAVLEHACRTVDELAALQAALADAEPMVAGSMGQPRPHPLYQEVRAHRDTLRRLLAQLDVPDDVAVDDRPMTNARASAQRRWANHRRDVRNAGSV